MLTKPRIWLVLLVVAVVGLAGFFALPNIFGSQPTLDITRAYDRDQQTVVLAELSRVADQALNTAGTEVRVRSKGNRVIAEMNVRATQLTPEQADERIETALAGNDQIPNVKVEAGEISNELIIFPDYSQQALDLAKLKLDQAGIEYERPEQVGTMARLRFSDANVQARAIEALQSMQADYKLSVNIAAATPEWMEQLGLQPMALGLDLRGGMSLLLEVAIDQAYDKRRKDTLTEIQALLRENKIRYRRSNITDDVLSVPLRKPEQIDAAQDLIRQNVNSVQLVPSAPAGVLQYELLDSVLEETRRVSMEKNLNTIRNRIEEIGIAEASVQQQGDVRIQVDLPGVEDRRLLDEIFLSNATISYHPVYRKTNPAHTNAAITAKRTGVIPPNTELLNDNNGNPALIISTPIVGGEDLIDARAGFDQQSGSPMVSVQLSTAAGFRMSKWTGANIKNLMAVKYTDTQIVGRDADGKPILETENTAISIATIQSQFSTNFQTTGLDSPAEAQRLALLLRSGTLAAPIYIISENTVSASLGADNIQQGIYATILGFMLVIAFMIFYYRGFGLVANTALIANLVLVVGFMSLPFIPATMTLPGIAGLVLTVGMAVDANVLIFERIREELAAGLQPQSAIVSGYQRALVTIADANITTLLTALILLFVGTGPVRGFAITLAIGIVASMFTAIVLTRVIVALMYGGNKKVNKISI